MLMALSVVMTLMVVGSHVGFARCWLQGCGFEEDDNMCMFVSVGS